MFIVFVNGEAKASLKSEIAAKAEAALWYNSVVIEYPELDEEEWVAAERPTALADLRRDIDYLAGLLCATLPSKRQ